MSIYTKTGDLGSTNLVKVKNVSKCDDRIELLGTLDELTSHLGLGKSVEFKEEIKAELEDIQKKLMKIMASIADPGTKDYELSEGDIFHLEYEINRMESQFPREKKFILPGKTLRSSYYDVSRTIARRSERILIKVDRRYGIHTAIKKYMNRLSDYLYILARYTEYSEEKISMSRSIEIESNITSEDSKVDNKVDLQQQIMNEVVSRLGISMVKMDLELSKTLITYIEEAAKKMSLNAVIALCSPEGNMIAVHSMDNAFIASFEIAMKKAYTSVAVKMSTSKLAQLAQPGETFYGIQGSDKDKLTIIGGGIPLIIEGTIVAGLGISGGTSKEDEILAILGQRLLDEIIKK